MEAWHYEFTIKQHDIGSSQSTPNWWRLETERLNVEQMWPFQMHQSAELSINVPVSVFDFRGFCYATQLPCGTMCFTEQNKSSADKKSKSQTRATISRITDVRITTIKVHRTKLYSAQCCLFSLPHCLGWFLGKNIWFQTTWSLLADNLILKTRPRTCLWLDRCRL